MDDLTKDGGYTAAIERGPHRMLFPVVAAMNPVDRTLKDFRLPAAAVQLLSRDAAFYDTMLVSSLLYEGFKQDVCAPMVEFITARRAR
ncbi:MAG: hypothetical protein WHS46_08285 [Desulfosoma sp.]